MNCNKSNKNKTRRKKLSEDMVIKNVISFKINDNDYRLLILDLKASGFESLSEYIREVLLKSSNKPRKLLSPIILKQMGIIGSEISRIGNNINQVARHANRMNKTGKIHPTVFSEFNKLMTEYLRSRRNLVKAYRAIMKNN